MPHEPTVETGPSCERIPIDRREAAGLVLICLVAAGLRVALIDRPMAYDETFTHLKFASLPLAHGLSDYSFPNNHLLHTLLVHVSTMLFGDPPWAIRLPAFLAGVAIAPLTYVLTSRLYKGSPGLWPAEPGRMLTQGLPSLDPARPPSAGSPASQAPRASRAESLEMGGPSLRSAGPPSPPRARPSGSPSILAAAIAGFSPYLVDYSTNARGYSMATVLAIGMILSADAALKRRSLRPWAVLVSSSALALYTIPSMVYAVVGVMLWLLACGWADDRPGRRKSLVVRLVAANVAILVLTILLYAPVLMRSGIDSIVANRFVETVALDRLSRELQASVRDTVLEWTGGLHPALGWALLGGLIASLVRHGRIGFHRRSLPAVLAAAAVLLVLVQRVVPFPRVWIYLLPPLVAAAATGLDHTATSFARTEASRSVISATLLLVVSAAVLHGSIAHVVGRLRDPANLETVAGCIALHLGPGDMFTAHGSKALPIAYYLGRRGLSATRIDVEWRLETWKVHPGRTADSCWAVAPRSCLILSGPENRELVETSLAKMQLRRTRPRIDPIGRFGAYELIALELAR